MKISMRGKHTGMKPIGTVSRVNWARATLCYQRGFTLVEMAIVLAIVGLVLGGVFQGQALVDSARVRAMSTEISGIQTAMLSFQERYRALAGDFSKAALQIDSAAVDGNSNGRIDAAAERAGVWQQLSLAGFVSGNYDGSQSATGTASDVTCSPATCPQNPFSGYYKISYGSQAVNIEAAANEIFTGGKVPVHILSQLDARLDDGDASTGKFRVHREFASACTLNGDWNVSGDAVDCAAVLRD